MSELKRLGGGGELESGERDGGEWSRLQTKGGDGLVVDVALDELASSPFQVKQYDDIRVKDLAETIRKQGLLQPATVRRANDGFQLISGHARLAAFRYLRDKFATTAEERVRYANLRCIVLDDVDDARAAALTAIENLQRDDGTQLEQALMVARARAAGSYESVAETAQALGLPRTRVRQYLELADAPAVLQRAVAPGVLVPEENGDRKRVALAITTALGARPYYDFLLSNRLAELKGKAVVQGKRNERRGRAAASIETKDQDLTRQQQAANDFATEKTEQLLARAAQHGWTGAQLQAHVRLATKPSLGRENNSPQPRHTARLYEDTGGRLTMWPQAIASANSVERTTLAEKLRILLQQLSS
jgi:ParB family transcriptional regulator, chromosome partitioning protein